MLRLSIYGQVALVDYKFSIAGELILGLCDGSLSKKIG